MCIFHFQGKVDHWDINNEMLHGNFFESATGDPDIRVKMFQMVQAKDPNVLRMVNDWNVPYYEADGYIYKIPLTSTEE